MSSWSELLNQHKQQSNTSWLDEKLRRLLKAISAQRGNAATVFYASAFLQRPEERTSITREDMNGFMNALYQMPTDNGLVLILHTPGGDPNAVESIVEYLHSKFDRIETIVPFLAMSGGAMISLASDVITLGRQSQLGPIDPQLLVDNQWRSARAIQEAFIQAKTDIQQNTNLAHLWAPILQNMGPSLILEADKALAYSKDLVVSWLENRMLRNVRDQVSRKRRAESIASYFNAEKTKKHGQIHVHGQRIGEKKLKGLGVKIQMLEDDQQFQDDVLTAFHLMTLIFETSPSLKFIATSEKMWVKQQREQQVIVPVQQPPG